MGIARGLASLGEKRRGRQAYQALLLFWGKVMRKPHPSASADFVCAAPLSFVPFTSQFLMCERLDDVCRFLNVLLIDALKKL